MDPEGSVELGQERRLGAMSPRSAMIRARSGVRRGMMAIASVAGVSVLAGCVTTTTEDGGGVTEMRQQEAPGRGSSGDSGVGSTAASTADAKLGSAGLIFAIVGGALMPPWQAGIIDAGPIQLGGFTLEAVRASFLLPLGCFVVVALYGFLVSRSNATQYGAASNPSA